MWETYVRNIHTKETVANKTIAVASCLALEISMSCWKADFFFTGNKISLANAKLNNTFYQRLCEVDSIQLSLWLLSPSSTLFGKISAAVDCFISWYNLCHLSLGLKEGKVFKLLMLFKDWKAPVFTLKTRFFMWFKSTYLKELIIRKSCISKLTYSLIFCVTESLV